MATQSEEKSLQKKADRLREKVKEYRRSAKTWEEIAKRGGFPKRDLKRAADENKKADKYEEELKEVEAELEAVREKDRARRNIPAIVEFLEGWKQRVKDWILTSRERYNTMKDEAKAEVEKLVNEYFPDDENKRNDLKSRFMELSYSPWYEEAYVRPVPTADRPCGKYLETVLRDTDMYKEHRDLVEKMVEIKKLGKYLSNYSDLDEKGLDAWLDMEANAKYDDIVARTEAKAGQIVDASMLSVGQKGELNGHVDGTKGSVWIETIGAGGYNIQCFHFRTLVKPSVRMTPKEIPVSEGCIWDLIREQKRKKLL